jgi:hypothetical protein
VRTSPYENLIPAAYWRTGVTLAHPLSPEALYNKRFELSNDDKIGTAGSCFAQHISKAMRRVGFNVLELEPAPTGLPEALWTKFGYGLYSARYSNIYTSRQFLQLLQEAFEDAQSPEPVWERDGRYFDSMRPAVEPNGLNSAQEVAAHRAFHLARVRQLFEELDVFIFTLGLTECWQYAGTDWVFPTAPGTIAGSYDQRTYVFRNLSHTEIANEMRSAIDLIRKHNKSNNLRFLFTVSPVPLTATYSQDHILVATTYSKSVLRAVAGELCDADERIAYFPSYEMVTAPWTRGVFYDANFRTVNRAGVDIIMSAFLTNHMPGDHSDLPSSGTVPAASLVPDPDNVECEEALLDAFVRDRR